MVAFGFGLVGFVVAVVAAGCLIALVSGLKAEAEVVVASASSKI